MSAKQLWYEKYRPNTIDQYVFKDDQLKSFITQCINDQSIPHLLFAGIQGSGKTTLARILINELHIDPMDVLTINASAQNGVDMCRNDITDFANSAPIGNFKVIHLEEANRLTPAAQDSLRAFMDDNADYVRFILTTNYVNQITPPLRSRCTEFHFVQTDINDVAEYVISILAQEHIKASLDTIDQYIKLAHPDVRKIINLIQLNSVSGELVLPSQVDVSSDYKFKIIEYLKQSSWQDIRRIISSSIPDNEWESLYRFVYENLKSCPCFQDTSNWEQAVVIIADHMYKHSFVADPEINATAMFIELSQLSK